MISALFSAIGVLFIEVHLRWIDFEILFALVWINGFVFPNC